MASPRASAAANQDNRQITSGEAIISTGEPISGSPASAFATSTLDPISGAMHLDLTDEESAALAQELHEIVKNARYPSFSVVADERGR